MRSLVWFRADLRTSDNAALLRAASDADRGVIGVFLVAADQWREHDWAPVKVDFLLRTLATLSADLRKLNIPLLIRRADRFKNAPEVLLALANEHGCDALHANSEYEVHERQRDALVTRAFAEAGKSATFHHDQTVLAPGLVMTKEGRPYTVFTPFKKAWINVLTSRGGAPARATPARQAALACTPDPVPDAVERFAGLKRPDLWPAGETAAKARLATFISERLTAYKAQRDFPCINGTSALSPWLAVGAISARQCLDAAASANDGKLDNGDAGAVHWISELVWREFYKHLIAAFPRLCMGRAFKPETEHIRWRDDPEGLAAWKAGQTGVPLVDAAMRQLLQTGWMHNRLRMVSAMFLTKDLFIDWREGEAHFMRHLVDGDLAQNNGGWQWSASTGTDAAPYFRIFNPVSQSRTYDPQGRFIRKFCPELADLDDDAIHEPWKLPCLLRGGIDYPPPIVEHSAVRERVIEAFQSISGKR